MLSSLLGRWTWRYVWLKLKEGQAAGVQELARLSKQGVVKGKASQSDEVYELVRKAVLQAYRTPMTRVIKFTGPAMAPTLNRAGTADPAAAEFLLTRRLFAPSLDNVHSGDVVYFRHPLGGPGGEQLMVRRVAAVGGHVLQSETSEHQLAPEVVWVVADNEKLEAAQVEDSRSFGPLPLENIMGRCIYAIRSRADHGHVRNCAECAADDVEVVAVELTEELLSELDDELHDAAPEQKRA